MKSWISLLLVFGLFVSGCDNGYSSITALDQNSSGDNGNISGGDNTDPVTPVDPDPVDPDPLPDTNVNFSAGIQSTIFGNLEIIRYNQETESIEVVIPFPLGGLGFEISGAVPNFPRVQFYTSIEDNALVLSLPIREFIPLSNNVSTLPNGRPLPGIPGGEPPSFSFDLGGNNSNCRGYIAPDYIGFFVEINFDPFFDIRVPIRGGNGQTVGYVHLLRPQGGNKGGVFLSVQLPREITALIEGIL